MTSSHVDIKEFMSTDLYKNQPLIVKKGVISLMRQFEPFFEYEIAYEKLSGPQRGALNALENHNWDLKKT